MDNFLIVNVIEQFIKFSVLRNSLRFIEIKQ